MPFTKTTSGKYISPGGRKFTKKQVLAYYTSDGFSKPVKKTSGKSRGKKKKK
jgi:hypothetical protein